MRVKEINSKEQNLEWILGEDVRDVPPTHLQNKGENLSTHQSGCQSSGQLISLNPSSAF